MGYTSIVRVLQHILRSPISVTAALSVAVLCTVLTWRVVTLVQARTQAVTYVATETSPRDTAPTSDNAMTQQEVALLGKAPTDTPVATSSVDTIAMIGPMVLAQLAGQYMGMQDKGSYSAQAGQQAAEDVAAHVRAVVTHKEYGVSDIKTDTDVSFTRMLTYRSDLRAALSPLLKNTDSELDIFGKFVETSDPGYLKKLSAAAENYHEAAANSAALTVPRDAVNYHKDILNAMEQFAGTLDQMATHGGDALASMALLRTYNTAEQAMYTSFNALSHYYSQKTP